jgi:hypothetical protein
MSRHGKNPTMREKKLIKAAGLIPATWLITKHIVFDCYHELHLESRRSGRAKVVKVGAVG